MDKAEGWLVHTDVSGSFQLSCRLWDAVYEGISNSDPEIISDNDKKGWKSVNTWLGPRRAK